MVDLPAETISDRVANLVTDILKKNSIDRTVRVNEDLVAIGLTSIDMVHLMLALEAAFDVALPQSSITPENFRSIDSIETMMTRLIMSHRPHGDKAGVSGDRRQ